MRKNITLATKNPNKLEELKELLYGFDKIEFELIEDEKFAPVENGLTFEQNSFIKAYEASKISKNFALSDDTGLCVEALNGRPGIFSARYAKTSDERIKRILEELKGKSDRRAKFVCVMTLVDFNGKILYVSKGELEGQIVETQKGLNGFGYDPIFYIPKLSKTLSELTMEEKNRISHRSKAFKGIKEWINTNLLIR